MVTLKFSRTALWGKVHCLSVSELCTFPHVFSRTKRTIVFPNSEAVSTRSTDVMIQGSTSQQKLCANVAAQIVAFACGKADDNNNKNFEGGRPSSIIIGEQVNPASLGALLAHFENKVMFQGFLWNLNSFDQEGVQLGKVLAKRVLAHETDGALKVFSDLLNI